MEIKLTNVLFYFRKKLLLNMMRSFIFLLCTSVFSFAPSNLLSQNAIIKIDHDKTVTVHEVFKLISDQTDYNFIYHEDLFKNAPKVQLKKGKIRVNKLLKLSISVDDLSFVFNKDGTIILRKKVERVVQQIISGKVTDEQGLPIPGVTVLIKDTKRGVSTNFDGNYKITVRTGEILRFTSVGYTAQEFEITNETEINVILKEETAALDEVLLFSIGYQKISKERATGSYSTITEKDLERQVTTNIVDRFEGLSPGLLTTALGGRGDEVKLTLRGQGTFNADDQPLVVVDGFPIEGNYSTINPNDVASITLLKDAAAASIWGVRAGNGVIVITTKRGKAGKMMVDFSTFYSVEKRPDISGLPFASSSAQLETTRYTIQDEPGLNSTYLNVLDNKEISNLNAVELVWLDFDRGIITSAERDARLKVLGQTNSYKQIEDFLYQNALKKQYNLSISGGNNNNRFYAGITYNNDEGVAVGNEKERININLKNDIDFNEKVRMTMGVNATFQNSALNGDDIGIWNVVPRYQKLVDDNGNRLDVPKDYLGTVKESFEDLGYLDWSYNPITEMEAEDHTINSINLRLQTGLTWDILPSLQWSANVMYERGTEKVRDHSSMETYTTRNLINRFTLIDGDGNLKYQIPLGGILDSREIETRSYTVRTQLAYDQTLFGKHQLSALMGVEARQIKNENSFIRQLGYDDHLQLTDTQVNWEALSAGINNFTGSKSRYENPTTLSSSKNRFISFYGNAAYTFDKRYTLSVSGKVEQSSIFGLAARLRANKLWSGGVAWNIANEAFFNLPFVNELKFRATYGVNGNTKRGITTETVFEGDLSWNYRHSYLSLQTVGNNHLTHEDNYVFNLGLDFSLFDYRLNSSLNYYSKRSENLLANFSTLSALGYNSQFINNGEIINQGIELSLGGNVIESQNFTWDSQLNLTYNTSEVLEYEIFAETAYSLIKAPYVKGEAIGEIMAYQWAGLSTDGTAQIYDETGNIVSVEDAEMTSKEALISSGSTIPPVFGSFNNTFNYKGFTLGIFLTYKLGHKFRKPTAVSLSSDHEDITSRWLAPGDENITDLTRQYTYDEYQNGQILSNWSKYNNYSTAIVEDASFVRVRDIYLDYHLGQALIDKLPFDNVKLRAQVRNPGFLWKATKENIDPDALYAGSNPSGSNNLIKYDLNSVFTLGINLQF